MSGENHSEKLHRNDRDQEFRPDLVSEEFEQQRRVDADADEERDGAADAQAAKRMGRLAIGGHRHGGIAARLFSAIGGPAPSAHAAGGPAARAAGIPAAHAAGGPAAHAAGGPTATPDEAKAMPAGTVATSAPGVSTSSSASTNGSAGGSHAHRRHHGLLGMLDAVANGASHGGGVADVIGAATNGATTADHATSAGPAGGVLGSIDAVANGAAHGGEVAGVIGAATSGGVIGAATSGGVIGAATNGVAHGGGVAGVIDAATNGGDVIGAATHGAAHGGGVAGVIDAANAGGVAGVIDAATHGAAHGGGIAGVIGAATNGAAHGGGVAGVIDAAVYGAANAGGVAGVIGAANAGGVAGVIDAAMNGGGAGAVTGGAPGAIGAATHGAANAGGVAGVIDAVMNGGGAAGAVTGGVPGAIGAATHGAANAGGVAGVIDAAMNGGGAAGAVTGGAPGAIGAIGAATHGAANAGGVAGVIDAVAHGAANAGGVAGVIDAAMNGGGAAGAVAGAVHGGGGAGDAAAHDAAADGAAANGAVAVDGVAHGAAGGEVGNAAVVAATLGGAVVGASLGEHHQAKHALLGAFAGFGAGMFLKGVIDHAHQVGSDEDKAAPDGQPQHAAAGTAEHPAATAQTAHAPGQQPHGPAAQPHNATLPANATGGAAAGAMAGATNAAMAGAAMAGAAGAATGAAGVAAGQPVADHQQPVGLNPFLAAVLPDGELADALDPAAEQVLGGAEQHEQELDQLATGAAQDPQSARQAKAQVQQTAVRQRQAVQQRTNAQTARASAAGQGHVARHRASGQHRLATARTRGDHAQHQQRQAAAAKKVQKAKSIAEVKAKLEATFKAKADALKADVDKQRAELKAKLAAEKQKLATEIQAQEAKLAADLAKRNADVTKKINDKKLSIEAQNRAELAKAEHASEAQQHQVTAAGETEAKRITSRGRSEANAAKQAAHQRAVSIRAQARQQAAGVGKEEGAEARAASIIHGAEGQAHAAEAQGKREADSKIERAHADADAAKAKAATEVAGLKTQLDATRAQLQNQLAAALAQAETERQTMLAGVQRDIDASKRENAVKTDESNARLAQLEQDSTARIDALEQQTRKKIQQQHDDLVIKLDGPNAARELAKLDEEANKVCAEIDKAVGDAQKAVAQEIEETQANAARQTQARIAAVQAEGKKAQDAIAAKAAEAERKIDAQIAQLELKNKAALEAQDRDSKQRATAAVADLHAQGDKALADLNKDSATFAHDRAVEEAAAAAKQAAEEKQRAEAEKARLAEEKRKQDAAAAAEAAKKAEFERRTQGAAQDLFAAMDGWGTDEKKVFRSLQGKSPEEIAAIKAAYQARTGHTLEADLTAEMSGNDLKEAKALLSQDPVQSRVAALQNAMQGWGTDEKKVKETLASMTDPVLRAKVIEEYEKQTGQKLSKALAAEGMAKEGVNPDDFKVTPQGPELDPAKVTQLAQSKDVKSAASAILAATDRWGTDERAVFDALRGKSPEEIAAIKQAFREHSGKDLDDVLEDEMSGTDLKEAKALLSTDPVRAAVAQLHNAADGWGTDTKKIHDTLKDIKDPELRRQVAAEYEKETGQTLDAMLEDELSGFDKDKAHAYVRGDEAEIAAVEADEAMHGGFLTNMADGVADTFGVDRQQVRNAVGGGMIAAVFPVGTVAAAFGVTPGTDFGTDNKALYSALESAKTQEERDRLIAAYKARTGRDLMADVNADLEGKERDVAKYIMAGDKASAEAAKMAVAADGMGTDKAAIYAALEGAQSKEERDAIIAKYNEIYGKDGQTFEQMLDSELDALDKAKAQQLAKSGKMDDGFALYYAMNEGMFGLGTDEAVLKERLQGKSKEEIERLKAEYAEAARQYGGRANADLIADVEGETSGRDGHELHQALKGNPTTLEEMRERLAEDYAFERTESGWVGTAAMWIMNPVGAAMGQKSTDVANGLTDMWSGSGQRLDQTHGEIEEKYLQIKNDPRFKDYDKYPPGSPERAAMDRAMMQELQGTADWQDGDLKAFEEAKDATADAASTAATIAVGAVITVASGGTAAPAVVALFSGLAGVSTKMLIKGGSMSNEEIIQETAAVIAEAAAAGIVKIKKIEALCENVGKLAGANNQLVANILKEATEEAIESGSEEIINAILDPELYKGDLADWAKGVAQRTGKSMLTGAYAGGVSSYAGEFIPKGRTWRSRAAAGAANQVVGDLATAVIEPETYEGSQEEKLTRLGRRAGEAALRGARDSLGGNGSHHGGSDIDTHADTHTDTKADTRTDTKADTHADTHVDTHADTHTDTKVDTQTEIQSSADVTPAINISTDEDLASHKAKPSLVGDSSHLADVNNDGVQDRARVGVDGTSIPDTIPRLPGLSTDQAAAEQRFAAAYERDPKALAAEYLDLVMSGTTDKEAKNFATDDAKLLSPDYNPETTGPVADGQIDPKIAARGQMNIAVHQTANAVAKLAFTMRLDQIAADANAPKKILVTAGGVGAGKSYAIDNNPTALKIKSEASAVWDSAGEQNSTELPWVIAEAKKRGIEVAVVYVHRRPEQSWENMKFGVIPRAAKTGRMVDARLHADSYAEGARNFDAVQQAAGGDSSVKFVVIDATGDKPAEIDRLPKSALELDATKVHERNVAFLETKQNELPEHVVQGGNAIGSQIWGAADPDAVTKRHEEDAAWAQHDAERDKQRANDEAQRKFDEAKAYEHRERQLEAERQQGMNEAWAQYDAQHAADTQTHAELAPAATFKGVEPGTTPATATTDQKAAFDQANQTYQQVRNNPFFDESTARLQWARVLAEAGIEVEGGPAHVGTQGQVTEATALLGRGPKAVQNLPDHTVAAEGVAMRSPTQPAAHVDTCKTALAELSTSLAGVQVTHLEGDRLSVMVQGADGKPVVHTIEVKAPDTLPPGQIAAQRAGNNANETWVWVSKDISDDQVARALGSVISQVVARANGANGEAVHHAAQVGQLDAMLGHLTAVETKPAAQVDGSKIDQAIAASKQESPARIRAEIDLQLARMGLVPSSPDFDAKLAALPTALAQRLRTYAETRPALAVDASAVHADTSHVSAPDASGDDAMRAKSTVLADSPAADHITPYTPADHVTALELRATFEAIAEVDQRLAQRDQKGTQGEGQIQIAQGETMRRRELVQRAQQLMAALQLGGTDMKYYDGRLAELEAVFPGLGKDLSPMIKARVEDRQQAVAADREAEAYRERAAKKSGEIASLIAGEEPFLGGRLVIGDGPAGLANIATLDHKAGSDGFLDPHDCLVLGGEDLIGRMAKAEPGMEWGQRAGVFDPTNGDEAHAIFRGEDGKATGELQRAAEDGGAFATVGAVSNAFDLARDRMGVARVNAKVLKVELRPADLSGWPEKAHDRKVRVQIEISDGSTKTTKWIYLNHADVTVGLGTAQLPDSSILSKGDKDRLFENKALVGGDEIMTGRNMNGKRVLVLGYGPTGAWASVQASKQGAAQVDWTGSMGTEGGNASELAGLRGVDRVQEAFAKDANVNTSTDRVLSIKAMGEGAEVTFVKGAPPNQQLYTVHYDAIVSAIAPSNTSQNVVGDGKANAGTMLEGIDMRAQGVREDGSVAPVLESSEGGDHDGAVRVLGGAAWGNVQVSSAADKEDLRDRRNDVKRRLSADSPDARVMEATSELAETANKRSAAAAVNATSTDTTIDTDTQTDTRIDTQTAAQGHEQAAPAGQPTTVRTVAHGETVDSLIAELGARTRETGHEYAIVTMRDGARLIVTSNQADALELPEGVRRIIVHTHPSGATHASSGDVEALRQLGDTERGGQRHSYIAAINGDGQDLVRFNGDPTQTAHAAGFTVTVNDPGNELGDTNAQTAVTDPAAPAASTDADAKTEAVAEVRDTKQADEAKKPASKTLGELMQESGYTVESVQQSPDWFAQQLLVAKGVANPPMSAITSTSAELVNALKGGKGLDYTPSYDPGMLVKQDGINERLGNIFSEKHVFSPAELQLDQLQMSDASLAQMKGNYESGKAGMILAASFINSGHRAEGDFSHAYGDDAWRGFMRATTMLDAIPKGQLLERLDVDTILETNRLIYAQDTGLKAKALRAIAMVGRGGRWDVGGELREGNQYARPEHYSPAEQENLREAGVRVQQWGKQDENGGLAGLHYPPASEVRPRLEKLIADLKADLAKPGADPILAASQFQRHFVALHPFGDSNGRTSRVLMNRILAEFNMPPAIFQDQDRDISRSPAEWRDEVAKGVKRAQMFDQGTEVASRDQLLAGHAGISMIPASPDKPVTISGLPFDLGRDGMLYDPTGRPFMLRGNELVPMGQLDHYVMTRRLMQQGTETGTQSLKEIAQPTYDLYFKLLDDPKAAEGITVRDDAKQRKADQGYQLAPQPEVGEMLAGLTDLSKADPTKMFSIEGATGTGTAASATLSKYNQLDLELWYVERGLRDQKQLEQAEQVHAHRVALFERAKAELAQHRDASRVSAENPQGFRLKYEKMMYDESPLRFGSLDEAIATLGDSQMVVWRGDYAFARAVGMAPNNDIRQPDAKAVAKERGKKNQITNLVDDLTKLEGSAMGRQYICTTSDLSLLAGYFANTTNSQTVSLAGLPSFLRRHVLDMLSNGEDVTPEKLQELRKTEVARGDSIVAGEAGGKELKDTLGVPGTIVSAKVVDKESATVEVTAPRKAFKLVLDKNGLLPGIYSLGGPTFESEQELHGLDRVMPWDIKGVYTSETLKEELPANNGGATTADPAAGTGNGPVG